MFAGGTQCVPTFIRKRVGNSESCGAVGAATAQTLGLDPKAIILAITFAASNDFATPVGYQTNTMIYGPSSYKFLDFTRVGAPLNLLLWLTTPIYIYLLWGV